MFLKRFPYRWFLIVSLLRVALITTVMGISWVPQLLVPDGAEAASAAQDSSLERSGVRYPEGFDINTVGEIQGKASGFLVPDNGPVTFTLTTKRETYVVFGSPKWYWEDLGVPAQDGVEVKVVGSKTLGTDGNLYVVAQELTLVLSRKSYALRSIDGSPLWRGPRIGAGGTGRAGEQPFRGGAGAGGRGRR